MYKNKVMSRYFGIVSRRAVCGACLSVILVGCMHNTTAPTASTPTAQLVAKNSCSATSFTEPASVSAAPNFMAVASTCQITNGSTPMHATVTSTASWVLFSINNLGPPSSSRSDIFFSNSTNSLQIWVRPNGLPLGPSTATITVASPEYQTIIINFTLTITNG